MLRQILAASVCCLVPLVAAAEDPVADIQMVAGPMGYTEGPAVAPDGSVYFTEAGPAHAVHRYDPETGETAVFLDKTESGGANGLIFVEDTLVIAEDRLDRVVSVLQAEEMDRPLDMVIAFDSQPFNGPNDLAIHTPSETLFFTDPKYGDKDFVLPFEAVFSVKDENYPDPPAVKLVTDQLERPNGIAVHGDTLYVADNKAKTVVSAPIDAEGNVGEFEVFAELDAKHGPDGMTVAEDGRVFVTLWGEGVAVFSPDGEQIGFIATGEQTSNVTMAEDGGLWVTARNGLLKVAPGAVPTLTQ